MKDNDRRDRSKYCNFHEDYGHETEKCWNLQKEIERLIKGGSLLEFFKKSNPDQRRRSPEGDENMNNQGSFKRREASLITKAIFLGGIADQ